jgi:hypothetical protein
MSPGENACAIVRAELSFRDGTPPMRSVVSRLARPGVFGGVLFLVGAASLGDAPDTRASTEQIADYFVTHRNSVFAAVILLGAATIALLWFVARERSRATRRGQDLSGLLTVGAGIAAVAVIDIGMLLQYATLSYVVGSEAPASAKAMFELTLLTVPIVSVPVLVLIGSVAWTEWRQHRITVRLVASLVAMVVLAAAPFSYAEHGAFSPDVQQQVLFNTLILWLVVSDIVRRPTNRVRKFA